VDLPLGKPKCELDNISLLVIHSSNLLILIFSNTLLNKERREIETNREKQREKRKGE